MWGWQWARRIRRVDRREQPQSSAQDMPRRSGPFQAISAEDVYYCYRLFLRREPDPQGWAAWMRWVEQGALDLGQLTDSFLYSDEFLTLQAERDQPRLIELPEFKLYVRLTDLSVGSTIARDGVYEPHVTRQLQSLLQPGMTFLDIGGNIGYFALLAAARVGPQGRVIVFEPRESNRNLLDLSVQANGFTHIQVYPYAVAEKAQVFNLLTGGADSNARVAEPTLGGTSPGARPEPVEAVALDGCLGAIERLDVVKMDIEGAEPRALAGMQALIGRCRPVILTEYSPRLIRETSHVEPEDYLNQLRGQGYTLFIVGWTDDNPLIPASPAALAQAFDAFGGAHLDLMAFPSREPADLTPYPLS